jgi:hypothetical protein
MCAYDPLGIQRGWLPKYLCNSLNTPRPLYISTSARSDSPWMVCEESNCITLDMIGICFPNSSASSSAGDGMANRANSCIIVGTPISFCIFQDGMSGENSLTHVNSNFARPRVEPSEGSAMSDRRTDSSVRRNSARYALIRSFCTIMSTTTSSSRDLHENRSPHRNHL